MIQHKIPLMLCALLSINLTACHSVGNVVPQKGLSMEQAYDDMGYTNAHGQSTKNFANASASDDDDDPSLSTNPYEANMKQVRHEANPASSTPTTLRSIVPHNAIGRSFHKVPNPTLKLFVYPHLAGNDELPVPGYTTAFNAYDKDHYAVSNDASYE